MIIAYNGIIPTIGKNVFIAPTAIVLGDVTIADHASIWFNAVLRGDMAPITIGANSNIQDNCTIHTDIGLPVTVGANVTIGHNAVVHGCTIDDDCLIGMGAILLNGSHVGTQSVVAAGAVVREGSRVGPGQLAAGSPAVVKKEVTAATGERIKRATEDYLELSAIYLRQKIGPR